MNKFITKILLAGALSFGAFATYAQDKPWPGSGGSGGGGTPGGTNGQLQYNNSGAFGGFTPGGDVTFSNPNFTVTSTGGVAFANIATSGSVGDLGGTSGVTAG